MGLSEAIYQHSPVWVQNLLITAFGWQWKKRRLGGVFSEHFTAARERESYTADLWKSYQQEALQRLLLHAFDTVPFYTKSFLAAGIQRSQLATITPDTIGLLPVLSKEQLRLYGTTALLSLQREPNGSFFASSGSTGTPVQILLSHAMHQRWFALFEQRVRVWAGVGSTIPRGMIGGRRMVPSANANAPFYRYNYFEKQVYFSAYHIKADTAANYVEGMRKYQIEYMTGYAMSNYFLARHIQEQQLNAPALKAVITSSEKLTPQMRELFKQVYGCKTYDGWSGVEACGLISECEAGSLHISPDAGLIEVLDEQLQPVPFGVAGAVYCTGFLNVDQPLIRYKIGDDIILSDKICTCGRQMPVVQEITGRSEDVIVGTDGRQMVRFHSVFNGLTTIKQAQVIQESLQQITIKLVADGNISRLDMDLMQQRIQSQLGDVKITFEIVDAIPLQPNGKYKAVISKLP
jgi:phenylacetate-CoA ligase